MSNQENRWKSKMSSFLSVCQDELVKTTKIGKKMISATTFNSQSSEGVKTRTTRFRFLIVRNPFVLFVSFVVFIYRSIVTSREC